MLKIKGKKGGKKDNKRHVEEDGMKVDLRREDVFFQSRCVVGINQTATD